MLKQDIVMNFTSSPTIRDIEALARYHLNSLPPQLAAVCPEVRLFVEDFPDDQIEAELDLATPFDLIAYYKSAKIIAPGIQKKLPQSGEDILHIYRRPLLDMWCESNEDLSDLVRHVILEEMASHFDILLDDTEIVSLKSA